MASTRPIPRNDVEGFFIGFFFKKIKDEIEPSFKEYFGYFGLQVA